MSMRSALLLLRLVGASSSAQETTPEVAIEGLDPVLLVQGRRSRAGTRFTPSTADSNTCRQRGKQGALRGWQGPRRRGVPSARRQRGVAERRFRARAAHRHRRAERQVLWRNRGLALRSGERLILLDEDGQPALASATREGLLLQAKFQLFDGLSWTVPTLDGTLLYARDCKQIVALDLK